MHILRVLMSAGCLLGWQAMAQEEPARSTESGSAPNLPPELLPLAWEAKTQFERADYAGAEKMYRQILEKVPNNLYTLSNLGVVLFREGKNQLASEMFSKAIGLTQRDPASPGYAPGIWIGQRSQREIDDEFEELKKAVEINPQDARAHNALAMAASQKGLSDLATRELETAITLEPQFTDAHFNLAVVFAIRMPPDKANARQQYQRALELGAERDPALESIIKVSAEEPARPQPAAPPSASGSTTDLPPELLPLAQEAKNQFERGNLAEAENAYRKMLEQAPENLSTLTNLGVVLFRTQKLKKAEEVFEKAVALAPGDGFAHCTLGIIFYTQGKYDDAVNELTKALAIDPKNAIDPTSATAHNYLGLALSQKGRGEAARKELETAATLDPKYADAQFNLAVVLATMAPPDKVNARKYYRRAIELGADRDKALEELIGEPPGDRPVQ